MVNAEAMDPAQVFMMKILSRNKVLNELTRRGDSPVQQFYNGAVVFLTGGSGYLGKQLIEKLFRATKISKVFVLLRPKKGKDIQQRLNEMLQDPVYDMVREQEPDFAAKIIPILGDVGNLKLGMSDEDWETVAEQVQIIFHLAATTRFDEPLRVATMINVRGTREALKFGKVCRNLKSYVHVSTAYSHACFHRINSEVLEEFYQTPIEPETMIKLAESTEEGRLEAITAYLIKSWPNTYTFTKAVSEEMVRSMSDELPICVVRPAIVISPKREPHPGWLDMSSLYSATGLIVASALGLSHVVLTDDNVNLGLTPVDHVNNAIIAAAYETARKRAAGETKTKIYTVATTARNPGIWGKVRPIIEDIARVYYPTPRAVWFCFTISTNKPMLFWILSWLLHRIPAYIADGLCFVLGKERRFVKLYSKMQKMSLALCHFSLNSWKFVDDNTAALYDSLSTVDQEIFDFDVKNIHWHEFLLSWCIGMRKYIIKDDLKGTAYAVRKQAAFKILTFIGAPLYFYFLYKVLFFIIYELNVLKNILVLK